MPSATVLLMLVGSTAFPVAAQPMNCRFEGDGGWFGLNAGLILGLSHLYTVIVEITPPWVKSLRTRTSSGLCEPVKWVAPPPGAPCSVILS